jgi:hypothetical protein
MALRSHVSGLWLLRPAAPSTRSRDDDAEWCGLRTRVGRLGSGDVGDREWRRDKRVPTPRSMYDRTLCPLLALALVSVRWKRGDRWWLPSGLGVDDDDVANVSV